MVSGWHQAAGSGPEQHHPYMEDEGGRSWWAELMPCQVLVSRAGGFSLQQQNINSWVCAQKQEPEPPTATVVHSAWLDYKPMVRYQWQVFSLKASVGSLPLPLPPLPSSLPLPPPGDHQPQQAGMAGGAGVPAVQSPHQDAHRKRFYLCVQQWEGERLSWLPSFSVLPFCMC